MININYKKLFSESSKKIIQFGLGIAVVASGAVYAASGSETYKGVLIPGTVSANDIISSTWANSINTGMKNLADKVETITQSAIKITPSSEACTSANEGTLRYNTASKKIEVCDGTSWDLSSLTTEENEGWTDWTVGEWSKCSSSCGEGIQTQLKTRTCGSISCDGESSKLETRQCESSCGEDIIYFSVSAIDMRNGDKGGYSSARSLCDSAIEGANILTEKDISNIDSRNIPFVDRGEKGYILNTEDIHENNCDLFNESSSSGHSISISLSGSATQEPVSCDKNLPIFCRKNTEVQEVIIPPEVLDYGKSINTVTKYTGDLGGIIGANQKCAAEYPGYEMAKYPLTSENLGNPAAVNSPNDEWAWVDGDNHWMSYSMDCKDWTIGTNSDQGGQTAIVNYQWGTNSSSTVRGCGFKNPIKCVKALEENTNNDPNDNITTLSNYPTHNGYTLAFTPETITQYAQENDFKKCEVISSTDKSYKSPNIKSYRDGGWNDAYASSYKWCDTLDMYPNSAGSSGGLTWEARYKEMSCTTSREGAEQFPTFYAYAINVISVVSELKCTY